MSKEIVELAVDIPDGYEATGEYRPAKGEWHLTWLGDPGFGVSSYPVIILRKIEQPARPKVPGPEGWPKLKWLAKTSSRVPFLTTRKPCVDPEGRGGYKPGQGAVFILPEEIGWNLPDGYAEVALRDSLTELTHSCQWQKKSADVAVLNSFVCECIGEKVYGHAANYCANCGRAIEVVK